jgi:hypothetical protein
MNREWAGLIRDAVEQFRSPAFRSPSGKPGEYPNRQVGVLSIQPTGDDDAASSKSPNLSGWGIRS